MSDYLIGAIVVLFLALLSLRPLTADTCTWADYCARARRAGWRGCLLGTLRVALVTVFLVLTDAARICLPAVELVGRAVPALLRGVVLLLEAMVNALMQAGRPAVGGAA